MGIPVYQVDAFTAEPFRGNPAAVCLLEEPLPDATMQAIAAEMNLSETAFLRREGDAWRLRWFTPATEVELCGHATLAAAHVLGEDAPRFLTRSGELRAHRQAGWIELDFPSLPPRPEPAPPGLLEALAVEPVFTGTSRFDRIVELESEGAVRAVAPDFARLAAVDTRGVIVTSRAAGGGGIDFVSRFFCPAVGIDEDPVTGSAHCVLAPFWAERLGRTALTGYQASARGGVVRVRLEGDRTLMAGQAVTIMQGVLLDFRP